LVVTLLTPAAGFDVLGRFYQKAQPPGFWGPVAAALKQEAASTTVSRMRRQWSEVLTGLYGSGFAAGLILGMSALLVRRFATGGLLLLLSAMLGVKVLGRAVLAGGK
jgi:hypothetical protein